MINAEALAAAKTKQRHAKPVAEKNTLPVLCEDSAAYRKKMEEVRPASLAACLIRF